MGSSTKEEKSITGGLLSGFHVWGLEPNTAKGLQRDYRTDFTSVCHRASQLGNLSSNSLPLLIKSQLNPHPKKAKEMLVSREHPGREIQETISILRTV